MLAYHGDPEIKQLYLARVAAHRAADQLVQGTGWAGGKGCAVGCTLEVYDHARYPIELGIPLQLAYLEDRLFELQAKADAQLWPERFLGAIRPGADLAPVWGQWAVWMLADAEWGVLQHAKSDASRAAILEVARLYREGGTPEQFQVARRMADAAVVAAADDDAAADAAYYAAAYAAAGAAWGSAGQKWTRAAADKLVALLEAA